MIIRFIDAEREPKCAPHPAYPHGIDIDLSRRGARSCLSIISPYPAPRCGWLEVKCDVCGYTALITVAGRADDPRSVRIPCKENK